MPKDCPLTASCGEVAQATLARAAISPHPTHLRHAAAAALNRAALHAAAAPSARQLWVLEAACRAMT